MSIVGSGQVATKCALTRRIAASTSSAAGSAPSVSAGHGSGAPADGGRPLAIGGAGPGEEDVDAAEQAALTSANERSRKMALMATRRRRYTTSMPLGYSAETFSGKHDVKDPIRMHACDPSALKGADEMVLAALAEVEELADRRLSLVAALGVEAMRVFEAGV